MATIQLSTRTSSIFRISPAVALTFLALLAVALAGCGGNDKKSTTPAIRHPQDFFPQGVTGMTLDGSPRTATTDEELEAIIDGGSTIYTAHNFREFAQQDYQGTIDGTQSALSVWIFEMASEQDAQELHADEQVQTGNCQNATDVGEQERICPSFNSQMIQFQRDAYWVRLTITNTSQDARDLTTLVATHIDQKIMD
jgi:hypothetical protein